VTSGGDVTSLGFAAYQWQVNSGISSTLHRGYDAELGRWLSEDPLGLLVGSNLYAYVRNQPVSEIDTLGLSPWYGNYCGPGSNPGRSAIDVVDAACESHDRCYERAGVVDGEEGYNADYTHPKACELNECDRRLCVEVLTSPSGTFIEDLAGGLVALAFCFNQRTPPRRPPPCVTAPNGKVVCWNPL
jgi:RHS repeat-associated protein